MIYKEIPIQVEGSDKTRRAQFYILDTLPDEMKIQKSTDYSDLSGRWIPQSQLPGRENLLPCIFESGLSCMCVTVFRVTEAFYRTQLLEVTESVRQIHEHAKEWYIDTKKIVLAGASAGGHLAANYCAFWKREFLVEKSGMPREMLKPRGLILCYRLSHRIEICAMPSFQNLLGDTVGRGLELIFGSSDYRFHAALFYLAYSNRSDSTAAEFFAAAMALWKAGIRWSCMCIGRDSWTQPCQ